MTEEEARPVDGQYERPNRDPEGKITLIDLAIKQCDSPVMARLLRQHRERMFLRNRWSDVATLLVHEFWEPGQAARRGEAGWCSLLRCFEMADYLEERYHGDTVHKAAPEPTAPRVSEPHKVSEPGKWEVWDNEVEFKTEGPLCRDVVLPPNTLRMADDRDYRSMGAFAYRDYGGYPVPTLLHQWLSFLHLLGIKHKVLVDKKDKCYTDMMFTVVEQQGNTSVSWAPQIYLPEYRMYMAVFRTVPESSQYVPTPAQRAIMGWAAERILLVPGVPSWNRIMLVYRGYEVAERWYFKVSSVKGDPMMDRWYVGTIKPLPDGMKSMKQTLTDYETAVEVVQKAKKTTSETPVINN